MKSKRTFCIQFELSERLDKISGASGDGRTITWHLEQALQQYLDTIVPMMVPIEKSKLVPTQRPKATKRFTPPTRDEAFIYFSERGLTRAITESEKFVDFYQSKNWMVGKNKMKDWKAAARNWMRKSAEHTQPTNNQAQSPMKLLTDTSWAPNLIEGE